LVTRHLPLSGGVHPLHYTLYMVVPLFTVYG